MNLGVHVREHNPNDQILNRWLLLAALHDISLSNLCSETTMTDPSPGYSDEYDSDEFDDEREYD